MDESGSVTRRRLLASVGGAGALSLAGCIDAGLGVLPGNGETDLTGHLSVEWTSETGTEYGQNHHGMAVATVDDGPVVGVPLNDLDGAETCGVAALDASGEVRWYDTVPPEQCTPHAIGDVGVSDVDGDGRPDFLVATEQGEVVAHDAATGETTFQGNLFESIGYNEPVVRDLTGDGDREIVAVDIAGNLAVVRADGSEVWHRELGNTVYVTPVVADLTGDGSPELAVNYGQTPGYVVCLDAAGEVLWRTELDHVSTSWTYAEPEAGPALVAGARDGVTLLGGEDGEPQWSTTVADRVAVGDADRSSVYVVARDGVVRALDLDDGTVRWSREVTGDVDRMTPPVLGSVTDDGSDTVVVAGTDGTVAVLDARSGELLGGRRLDETFYTPPETADVTGDGVEEILVLYGRGRVAALSLEGSGRRE